MTDDLNLEKLELERRAALSTSLHWRLNFYRPSAVGFAGVTLTILSLFGMTSAPFFLVLWQMNGDSNFLPGVDPTVISAIQGGASAFLCLLAVFILRGKNWARWLYCLSGAAGVAFITFRWLSPWDALVGLVYLLFVVLLFLPESNEFFRLVRLAKKR